MLASTRYDLDMSLSLRRHRFPAEVISHAIWLCFRFA
jgi:transposase-like protein